MATRMLSAMGPTVSSERSASPEFAANNSGSNNSESSNYYPGNYANYPATASYPQASVPVPRHRFSADLSQCLFDFVIQLLPTTEELSVKEDVRKLLERLIRTIEPKSKLLSFGSTANGFSLRNSDMDLCCLIDSSDRLPATDLVTMVGDLLERETKFHVKPLPHARIPIVKLSLDPSPGLPCGIACDIGFENRLALENTRLLMCYAMIDPTRVRTMVLFLKVWSKRRKINSPYKGTLSSYGYVLMVIYFLVHVKNPPVLPNLQTLPPMRPIGKEETHVGPHNTWFFDDIDLLRQHWHSDNTETVAELLIEFFRYYSKDFPYSGGVLSIRAGILKKENKGWQSETRGPRYNDGRERNRFCIEDPFEIDFNVSRCVTKDGLYTIRGELMRASRILQARPERAILALAELCEERPGEDLVAAPPYPPPRPPPQTPYTVGSKPLRNKSSGVPVERLSPPTSTSQSPSSSAEPKPSSQKVSIRPPDHMAPRRGKWTSPPPPEAPLSAHALFEDQFEHGLELATANTDARELERRRSGEGSSNSSEIYTDPEDDELRSEDDVRSIQSYTEGVETGLESPIPASSSSQRRPSWLAAAPSMQAPLYGYYPNSDSKISVYEQSRGNRFYRPNGQQGSPTGVAQIPTFVQLGGSSTGNVMPTTTHYPSKRSSSGPPRTLVNGGSPAAAVRLPPIALDTPLPPSPESDIEGTSTTAEKQPLDSANTSPQQRQGTNNISPHSTVFYQSSPSPTLNTGISPRTMPVLYPTQQHQHGTYNNHNSPSSSTSPTLLHYQQQQLQQHIQLLQQQQYHLISGGHAPMQMKDDVLSGVPGLTTVLRPSPSAIAAGSTRPIYTPMPLQHHHHLLHSPEQQYHLHHQQQQLQQQQQHLHTTNNNGGMEVAYVGGGGGDDEGLDMLSGGGPGPETPTPMTMNHYVRGSGGPGGASGGVSLGSPSMSAASSSGGGGQGTSGGSGSGGGNSGKRRGGKKVSVRSGSPLLGSGHGQNQNGGGGGGYNNGKSMKGNKGAVKGGGGNGGGSGVVRSSASGLRRSSTVEQQQLEQQQQQHQKQQQQRQWQGPPPGEAESSGVKLKQGVANAARDANGVTPLLATNGHAPPHPSPLNLGSSSNHVSSTSPSSSSSSSSIITIPKPYDHQHPGHHSPSHNHPFTSVSSRTSNSSSPSPPLIRAPSSPSSSSVLSRRSSLQEVDDMEWPQTPPATATPANFRGKSGLTIYEEDEGVENNVNGGGVEKNVGKGEEVVGKREAVRVVVQEAVASAGQ